MDKRTREQLGAATGLVVVALMGIAFIVGISPKPPGLDAPVGQVQAFIVQNQNALRLEVFFTSLAMLFFLWFLGSVRAKMRSSERGAGRVSGIASGGGIVGVVFVLSAMI